MNQKQPSNPGPRATFAPRQASRGALAGAPGLSHVRALMQANPLVKKHLYKHDMQLALYGWVLERLPPTVRGHCCETSLLDGQLTIFFDSAAWATRARFHLEELARLLRQGGPVTGVTKVRAKVKLRDPAGGVPSATDNGNAHTTTLRASPGARLLGVRAAEHLIEAAAGSADAAIAAAFRRLASRHLRES